MLPLSLYFKSATAWSRGREKAVPQRGGDSCSAGGVQQLRFSPCLCFSQGQRGNCQLVRREEGTEHAQLRLCPSLPESLRSLTSLTQAHSLLCTCSSNPKIPSMMFCHQDMLAPGEHEEPKRSKLFQGVRETFLRREHLNRGQQMKRRKTEREDLYGRPCGWEESPELRELL